MKKILILVTFLAVIIGVIYVQSCKKEALGDINYNSYTYAGVDSNGGNWKTFLLTSGSQFTAPVPADVNSASYQQELENLKTTVKNLTPDQKQAINYWNTSSLIRWDEIANDLAAKYNLPPSPNPDGSYPAPDANNPSAYPNFPFATPPYTCRMFAYWSGAQFDALITVWKQKYTYRRAAPYSVDPSITTLLPKTDLPSYPSEDAAIAAVSEVVLTAMFPLEKDFIKQKADELKNTRIWAGMNVPSDIAAGDSIGRQVAAVFMARSKTDGMKGANMTVAQADSETLAAQQKWGWHWENLETPRRHVGILPLFSNVKPWFIPNVEAVRPPVPPTPGSDEFNKNVEELKGFEKHLTENQRDIALFWNDGPSTYTPPGQWNRIAYPYIIQNRLNPLRTARVFAYLNAAIEDAGISCWDAKYYYHYPRPSATSGVNVLIPIPSFPSYPSGHSTFSGAGSTVLSYFFPEGATSFKQQAQEAADSRVYARIHFRFDSENGLTQGQNVGSYAVEAAQQDGAQ